MLIDSHNHAWWINCDVHTQIAEMDRLGIDVAWLLTWYLPPAEDNPNYHLRTNPINRRPDGTHAAMPLADLLEARAMYPTRFVAGYCPCPLEGDAPALFESAYHIHGVRVCGEWSYRMPFDDPRAIQLFRAAGRLKCPVVLHMDVAYLPDKNGQLAYQTFWHGNTIEELERAMQRCRETIFVGHAPGFWREISGDASRDPAQYPAGPLAPGGRLRPLFERNENLWADLSAGSGLNALRRDTAHARDFVLQYQDRLMFGRDQFGDDLLKFLPTLDLPAEVLRKIYSENALRLVPLDAEMGTRAAPVDA